MSTNYLFSDIDFGDFADSRKHALASRMEKLVERHFQGSHITQLTDDYVSEFSLKYPVMLMDQVFQRKPLSIKIGVDSEYNGKVTRKVEGTRYEIILPFSGDSELLSIRPSAYSFDPPYGQVENDGIHFIYEVQIFHDNALIRNSFDQNFQNIGLWLENLCKDVTRFNATLENEVETALRSRLGSIAGITSGKNIMGFPIK